MVRCLFLCFCVVYCSDRLCLFFAFFAAKHLDATKWLLGRGWDQTLWPQVCLCSLCSSSHSVVCCCQPVFPTAKDLDAAFPNVRAGVCSTITTRFCFGCRFLCG